MRLPTHLVANLARSAQRTPERCAILQDGIRTSYAELWQRTRSFAGYLRQHGLHCGDRVAVLLENSPEFVVAFYGTLLAGGIAVALNCSAKARELSTWLCHSEPDWLVTDGNHSEVATALTSLDSRPRVIAISAISAPGIEPVATLADVFSANPPCAGDTPSDGQAEACIVYTSGTTGNPKGVVLTHGNLASNTAAIVEYLGLSSADSVLSVLPFYYSYGASVLHTHIQAGACIVLESGFAYPHRAVANLAKQRISGFAGVPSTFSLLLSRVDLRQFDLDALRYVTQAGGAMSPVLTQRLRVALPNVQIFVMYGQTEATARLTYLPPDKLERKLGSVGIPVSGVELQIRRENGALAAPLETGEIWARGPGVMRGYWRDTAATALVVCDGWLRTGDLGHIDAEGYLYLLGRRSDMIKTGAHRVHPRDIEEVLQELPQIAEAAVIGIDDDVLGQAIAAYIVPAPQATIDVLQIKAHCRDRLTNYKIPRSVQIVAELPRTASGKIRRIELSQRKPP